MRVHREPDLGIDVLNSEEEWYKEHECVVDPEHVFRFILELLGGELGIHLVDVHVHTPQSLVILLDSVQRPEVVEQGPDQQLVEQVDFDELVFLGEYWNKVELLLVKQLFDLLLFLVVVWNDAGPANPDSPDVFVALLKVE